MRTKVFSIISILAIAILMVACAGSGSNPTPPPNPPPTPVTTTSYGAAFGRLGLGSTIFKKTTTVAFNWSLTQPAFAATTDVKISGNYHGACRNLASIPVAEGQPLVNQYALMTGVGTWQEAGCQGEPRNMADPNASYNVTDSAATLGDPNNAAQFKVIRKPQDNFWLEYITVRKTGAPVIGDGALSSFVLVVGSINDPSDRSAKVWVLRQGSTTYTDTGLGCTIAGGEPRNQCNDTTSAPFPVSNGDKVLVVFTFKGSQQDVETFLTKQ